MPIGPCLVHVRDLGRLGLAADANTTSPADGVIHTFNRVSDLLEAIDEDLGDTGLMNQLLQATNDMGRTSESWSTLVESLREAVDRLRSR